MVSMRQRRVRGIGSLLLALLLLVPVVASGHRHAGHATPCAACAVTHHTPVVSASGITMPATTPVVLGVESPSALAPTAPSVRLATGRGPPSLLRALGS
jgi:hypothetical protein